MSLNSPSDFNSPQVYGRYEAYFTSKSPSGRRNLWNTTYSANRDPMASIPSSHSRLAVQHPDKESRLSTEDKRGHQHLNITPLSVQITDIWSTSYPIQGFCWDHIEYVYAFGDSYSLVPGTFGLPSFSFIGDATRLAFTPEQLLSNRIIPNKTSSGGSNWLQYLTDCFEGLPASGRKQLWDFAHGGAKIDNSLLPPRRNTTVELVDQVRQWVDYAADILPKPAGRTLTTWWIGTNDCRHACDNETVSSLSNFPVAFVDASLESYFNIVKTAAHNGLRTHLFLNVPPLDRSPSAAMVRTGVKRLKEMIGKFNKKLAIRAAEYAKENPDQLVLTVDAASVFTRILDNPKEFGLEDTTTSCPTCQDEESFFWHNAGHPTEHVHRILAGAVEEYLRSLDHN